MRRDLLAAGFALAAGLQVVPTAQPVERQTVWSGVYTSAQAARGAAVFRTHCEHCHGADLGGGEGPSLISPRFRRNWTGLTLRELFLHIKIAMPEDAVTSVTDGDKLDALAFILQRNDFPAGAAELSVAPAALGQIAVEGKDGPEPAPTGSTVVTVGCLAGGTGSTWQLQNATAPVRTTFEAAHDPDTALPGLEAPAGNQSIKLMGLPANEVRIGQKVAVIGFMVREPGATGINVVEIKTMATTCSP